MGDGLGYENQDEWSREILERRRRRRAEDRRRRRMYMRRRLVAIGALFALVLVPVLLLNSGGKPKQEIANREAASATTLPAADGEGAAGADNTGTAPDTIPTKAPEMVTGFDSPVPILMYHVIAEAPVGAANPGLFVPPEELEEQVRWLAKKGYTAVTLSDLFDAWFDGGEIPSKPVVLSFDDGTSDQHDVAARILAAAGWPGVLNLKVLSLNQHEMSDEMIEDMLSDGWELASHTRTHPDLAGLDAATLQEEVAGSRKALQRRFDVPVDFFCYPSGSYDAATIDAVKAAGYRGATTTVEGLATPDSSPYELSRIRVNPGDGASGLAAELAAAGA